MERGRRRGAGEEGLKFWGFRGGWIVSSGGRHPWSSPTRTTQAQYYQAPRETAFSNITLSSYAHGLDTFWLSAELGTRCVFLSLTLGVSGGRRGWGSSIHAGFFVEDGKPSADIELSNIPLLGSFRLEWMSHFREFVFRWRPASRGEPEREFVEGVRRVLGQLRNLA
jgi:hypothetical protein